MKPRVFVESPHGHKGERAGIPCRGPEVQGAFLMEPPEVLSDEEPVVRLDVVSGPLQGRFFTFESSTTWVVGRSARNQLSLDGDLSCSRYHCCFEVDPPRCMAIDLKSRNGTYVNGQRITDPVELQDGDHVVIGQTTIRISTDSQDTLTGCDALGETMLFGGEHALPTIEGYDIDRQIGFGSMGVVYHGVRQDTGREVAVKMLMPGVRQRSDGLKHFLREATILTQLQHPHIVEALDFGVREGGPFLVMEFIDRVDLPTLLRELEEKTRVRMAAGVICRLLDALSHAHERRIVHRDVKPSNLLAFQTDRKTQVKLADFGLAKNFISAGRTALSQSGDMKGTLAYMAPEQILDSRYSKPCCDIYAAGACLYEFLSGKRPYRFRNVAEGLSMVLNASPTPLEEVAPFVPPKLGELVQYAMAKDPAERFASARDMIAELAPFTQRKKSRPRK